jgi:HAD superfamily hydrolase (TIGR01509 family)
MAKLPDPQKTKIHNQSASPSHEQSSEDAHGQSKRNQPPLKTILFDLDGTLVNSLPVTIEAFNQGLIAHGGKRHSAPEIIAHFGPGEIEIFENILGKDRAQAAYEICRNYTNKNLSKILFHQGILEVLTELRKMNIPFGLVTGRGQETTHLILNHLDIRSWFKVVICHEQVKTSKPSPEGILLALEQTEFSPQTCGYLGDMDVDIRAARGAGITSIAATWDLLFQSEQVKSQNPDHTLANPQELLGLLNLF